MAPTNSDQEHKAKAGSELVCKAGEPTEVTELDHEGFLEDPEVPRDSLGRVREQEDMEEEMIISHNPIVVQRIVPSVNLPRLFRHSTGIKELEERCKMWEGPIYPPPMANETFAGVICRLKVGPSEISGRGTFLTKGKLEKHELIGFYEGLVTLLRGPYVMEIFGNTSRGRNIDGCPVALGHESPFGMMNEDLYKGIPNVEVLPSGLFRAVRVIYAGEELVIRYADDYDWSTVKSQALAGLSDEIAAKVPELWNWIPKTWDTLKRPTNPLSRWIKKLIDGTLERDNPQLLHSSNNWDIIPNSRDRLARLLTSGVTARRFNYRIWTREKGKVWETVEYEADPRARSGYSRTWNYHRLMDIPFVTVYQDNENIKNFCCELNRMKRPNTAPRLTECPPITIRIGGLKVALNLGKARLRTHLAGLNSCSNFEQLAEYAKREKIWKVSYLNNPMDDEYPGEGWCGYLGIDQIMRNSANPANVRVPSDQRLLIKSLGEIVKHGLGSYRTNWRSLRLGTTLYDKEVVLSVIDTLMQASSFLPPPVLRIARWLPTRLLVGMFSKFNFSKWTLDPEDEEFNILADGQRTSGSTTNVEEWKIITRGKLLTIRRGHYHVRDAGWLDDMEEGFVLATRRLGILMGLSTEQTVMEEEASPLARPPGVPNRRPRSARRAEQQQSVIAETGCNLIELSSEQTELGGAPELTPELASEEVAVVGVAPPSAPALTRTAELKVVFWNANTWNSQNCEKLVETATVSEADVICIEDARLDNFKARYIGGYCHTLHKATGKIWRAKLEARPDRRLKCSVGGDIIFYSEKCTKVVKSPTLPFGTISTLSFVWEGIDVRVASVYRPYESRESSEGSLRSACLKVLPEFEDVF